MRIIIWEKAAEDLDSLFAWIAKDNSYAAEEMLARLLARIELLATSGLIHMGRPGLVAGTRELIEPPYVIVYKVREGENEIDVLAVVHGARNR
jgi:toxin ParE1/3/4